jgi:hypothetical protein
MPEPGIVIQAELHESAASWVIVPITLSNRHTLKMVLDTGSPVSAISPATAADLRALALLNAPPAPPYAHRLTAVGTADGRRLPDVSVIVLPRLARMRAVGIEVTGLLGLDFLRAFESVCYYLDARRLVLQPRTALAEAAPSLLPPSAHP